MTLSEKLELLATLAHQLPADMISAHEAGVTVVVSNFVTAARWREAFDAHPELDDADVRLLQMAAIA